MKTERLAKAISNNESVNNIIKSILSDIIDEVEITKGAMILDGYENEDSCIYYMNGLIKDLKTLNIIMKNDNVLTINIFSNLFNEIKSLDADISEWIDDNFWELI